MGRIGRLGVIFGFALALSGCVDHRSAPGLDNYETIMRVADATHQAGDVNGALVMYRKASMLAPTRPEPQLAIGKALLELDRVNEAIDAYRSAMTFSSNNPEALQGLSNAYLAARRPDLAMRPLEMALEQDPQNVKLMATLGVAADLSGDHRKAQTFYRRGMAIDVLDDGLVNNLALSLALTGDYKEAAAALKPIADGPRSSPRERQTLSLIYGLAGNRDLAGRYARMDLDEAAAAHNLAYFETLRGLPADARDRTLSAASWSQPKAGKVTNIEN